MDQIPTSQQVAGLTPTSNPHPQKKPRMATPWPSSPPQPSHQQFFQQLQQPQPERPPPNLGGLWGQDDPSRLAAQQAPRTPVIEPVTRLEHFPWGQQQQNVDLDMEDMEDMQLDPQQPYSYSAPSALHAQNISEPKWQWQEGVDGVCDQRDANTRAWLADQEAAQSVPAGTLPFDGMRQQSKKRGFEDSDQSFPDTWTSPTGEIRDWKRRKNEQNLRTYSENGCR